MLGCRSQELGQFLDVAVRFEYEQLKPRKLFVNASDYCAQSVDVKQPLHKRLINILSHHIAILMITIDTTSMIMIISCPKEAGAVALFRAESVTPAYYSLFLRPIRCVSE